MLQASLSHRFTVLTLPSAFLVDTPHEPSRDRLATFGPQRDPRCGLKTHGACRPTSVPTCPLDGPGQLSSLVMLRVECRQELRVTALYQLFRRELRLRYGHSTTLSDEAEDVADLQGTGSCDAMIDQELKCLGECHHCRL